MALEMLCLILLKIKCYWTYMTDLSLLTLWVTLKREKSFSIHVLLEVVSAWFLPSVDRNHRQCGQEQWDWTLQSPWWRAGWGTEAGCRENTGVTGMMPLNQQVNSFSSSALFPLLQSQGKVKDWQQCVNKHSHIKKNVSYTLRSKGFAWTGSAWCGDGSDGGWQMCT